MQSFSSQISQLTDDDAKSISLNVLSDEQIDHLAYEYHPYGSEFSSQTGMHVKSSNLLSESMLY